MATHPSDTTAPAEVGRTTGAPRHPQGATHTRRAGRKRSLGAKLTSGSAAAPGAASALHHALPPGTEAPARPSPPTPNTKTPGEASLSDTLCHLGSILVLTSCASFYRERDSPNRSDTDSRARRRSRSYSPIRKRRRDSPSFMEARRITR